MNKASPTYFSLSCQGPQKAWGDPHSPFGLAVPQEQGVPESKVEACGDKVTQNR